MLVAVTLMGAVAVPFTATMTQAQTTNRQGTVGTVLSGLINVNVQNVAINIGDITITDVVDVENVLNNNDIRILNNVLNNNRIANANSVILTALLRDVNLLTKSQVVVGVLNGQFLVLNLPTE